MQNSEKKRIIKSVKQWEEGRPILTVILTGGSSRRMGRDKAILPFAGSTLLQTQIDRYAAYGPVLVSVDRKGRFPFRGAAEVADSYPGQGPLNGIVSGFLASEAEELLLTAVDLPYGDPGLALRLSELRKGSDACVIRSGPKGIEPLFAVYGRNCLAAAEACLGEGRRSILCLLDRINVRYADPGELEGYDIKRIFTNVNTPEEYERL